MTGKDQGAPRSRGLVVGLTGGIATGKSTVAAMFAELGAAVVSADDVARRVTGPGTPALEEIRDAFGDDVFTPDGALDRAALGAVVFADERARRRLEALTHPRIRRGMKEEIDRAADAGKTVVAEIPLLFESEAAQALVDVTVVVFADEGTQRARLAARDGWTGEEAAARIAAQLPMAEKVARADYVVDNSGSEAGTRRQVRDLWRRLHAPWGGG